MNCKRGIFLTGIIILFLMFSISLVISVSDENKIDEKVYEMLEKNDEVRVVVSIYIEKEKGVFIKQEKTEDEINLEKQEAKEEIIRDVGEENVKHVFDEEIALEVSKDELNILNENHNVESVIIDKPIHAFLQQSIPYINASLVWPIQINSVNITGIDETICILDTGINFTHPALLGKNKTCVIDCYNKNCVENCSVSDDNGHGTHVAGIAAASGGINGVAIGANLIGVKVLDSSGSGSGTDLNAGINWCIANRNIYNISVISMSLGDCTNHSTYCNSDSSASFINNATAYNISVIVAAGNGPGGSCGGIITDTNGPAAPACVQNATAVGAVNDADNSISYQRGVLFELLAPGISINSTVPMGSCELCASSGYSVLSGTSMAAPHVAGAFALFRQFFRLQNNRIPTPDEIKATLNNTGKQINDSSGTGLNYSIINIYSAINSILKSVNVNLISPANNSFLNIAGQNQSFRCNTTSLNSNLTNITFYLWNSSLLIYNITQNITGTSNQTNFSYNFSSEDNYFWNCIAYNSDSFSNSNSNYTLAYDSTKPQINLISPNNSSTWTSSSTVSFSYNVSDISIANCSLIINNAVDQTDSSITVNTTETFTKSLSNGNYNWSINCTDSAVNINNSELRVLTVSYTAPVAQNTGGGGGGGGTATSKTYTITTEQALGGYTQTLSKSDKIKFAFFDEKEEQHTLAVDNLTENSVSLTIQSSIIKLKLGIGQSAKLNLTSADYYNFYIKLNSIANNKADITIQTIHEQIPKSPGITGEIIEENVGGTSKETEEETPQQKPTNIMSYIKDILIAMLIIAVLVALFSRSRKKNIKKAKTINEYKERLKGLKGKK
ncbi:MAG: S8 family serine peptidase [Nanoarchaeota archaeon]|nr:S8 family serine peptidase [Nanoarchaeota archaeon]